MLSKELLSVVILPVVSGDGEGLGYFRKSADQSAGVVVVQYS